MKQGQLFLGSFEVKRCLQRSRNAEVYHAWDVILRRDVCLKILRARPGQKHDIDSLYGEARFASDLRSPYTVRVLASGALPRGAGIYFVMEWADGGSVKDWVARFGPLKTPDLLTLLAQVGHSLAEAHQKGLVHRDIKPANLLVFPYGESERIVKVTDFGIAASLTALRHQARSSVVGTPEYLAPEAWEGGEVDHRVDIYALGVTAYVLLTGKLPFVGDSLTAMRDAHRFEPAPSLAFLSGVPQPVTTVIGRCLAKSPSDRPGSVFEFLHDIGAPTLGVSPPFRVQLHEELGAVTVVSSPTLTELTLDDLPEPGEGPESTAPPLRELRVVSGTWVEGDMAELLGWEDVVRNAGGQVIFRGVNTRLAVFGHTTAVAEAPLRATRVAAVAARFGKAAVHTVKVAAAELVSSERLRTVLEPTLLKLLDRARLGEPAVSRRTFERVDRLYGQHLEPQTQHGSAVDDGVVVVADGPGWVLREFETGSVELVGRASELAEIVFRVTGIIQGKPAEVVWIVGEAGVGKTRLCYDAKTTLTAQYPTLQWWTVPTYPEDAAVPFAVLRRWLWMLLELPEGTGGKACKERIEQRLSAAHVVGYRAISRDLGLLLAPDSVVDTTATQAKGPDVARLTLAVVDLLRVSVASAAVVTVVEDIHWADRESLGVIAQVMEATEGFPAAWVWSGRPEALAIYGELAGDNKRHPLIQLQGLPVFLTEQLCRNLVRHVTGDVDTLVRYLSVKTDGVPLYAEELLRLCVQQKAVFQDSAGQWCFDAQHLDDTDVPPSLESVLLRRIEHLSAPDRQAAQACAILGRRVTGTTLDLLLRWDKTQTLPQTLDRLVVAGVLVRETPSPGQPLSYRFSHALLADAAYRTVVEADRVVWHRRAAEWFESHGESRDLLEWMAVAATHWERCGDSQRAFLAHEKAADLAQTAFSMAAVRYHLQRCMALSEQCVLAPLTYVMLLIKLGRCFAHEQRHDEALAEYQRAEDALTANKQAPRSAAYRHCWATIGYVRALVLGSKGRKDEAQLLCEQALAVLKTGRLRVQDRVLAARIGNWLGWTLRLRGEFAQAETVVQTALRDLGPDGPQRERSTLLSALASLYAELGRPPDVVRQGHELAIRHKRSLYDTEGDAKALGAALVNYANYLIGANYLAEAHPWLDQATKIANDIEDQEMRAVILVNLAELSLSEHQPDFALRHLDRARKLAQQRGLLWMVSEIDRLVTRAESMLDS